MAGVENGWSRRDFLRACGGVNTKGMALVAGGIQDGVPVVKEGTASSENGSGGEAAPVSRRTFLRFMAAGASLMVLPVWNTGVLEASTKFEPQWFADLRTRKQALDNVYVYRPETHDNRGELTFLDG
ncbi:hypothetical protein MUP65_01625, partial [Patescibacteria group bacterium]|nr:hypothetical protein [Patescibacteria group bacterium]